MADQKGKKKGCKAAGRHHGHYERWSHSDYGGGPLARKFRQIIQSSGFAEAGRWAEKYGATSTLKAIQTKSVVDKDGRREEPIRWIERKLDESRQQSGDYMPIYFRVGRGLRRRGMPRKLAAAASSQPLPQP